MQQSKLSSSSSSYIRQKRILELSIVTGLFVFAPNVFGLLGIASAIRNQASLGALLVSSWDLVCLVLLVIVVWPRFFRRPGLWRLNTGIGISGIGFAAVLIAVALLLSVLFRLMSPQPPLTNFPFEKGFDFATFAAVLVRFGTGAVFEEVLFRAYLFERLKQIGSPIGLSFLVSILLFTWGHSYEGLQGSLTALVSGSILALVWIRWRSLWLLILSHFLYNVSVYLIAVFAFGAVSI